MWWRIRASAQELLEGHELPDTDQHSVEQQVERPVLRVRQLDLSVQKDLPNFAQRGEGIVNAAVAALPRGQHPPVAKADDDLAGDLLFAIPGAN